MIVKILGSVSPYCKGDLNCPGYLIRKGDTKILLDCGSGISRLLKFPDDLKNLTIIISHLHKDHYSDLASIGYASHVYHNLGLLEKRITVYVPKDEELEDFNYLINFGSEHFLNFVFYDESTVLNITNIEIYFRKTLHPVLTYAINIITNQKKISYSSDTGFDKNLISFFEKADLFICESTFLADQKKDNLYHLTAYEAGLFAKESKVKELLLTHFWPEINKNIYKQEAKLIFSNTNVAVEGKIITKL